MLDLQLTTIGDEPRIDSRLVAQGLDIQHETLLETIRKYQIKFEKLGKFITSETEINKNDNKDSNSFPVSNRKTPSDKGGRPMSYVLLNENQVVFAVTLSRNTEKVVEFKLALTQAFAHAKQQIVSQQQQLKELQKRLDNLPPGLDYLQVDRAESLLNGFAKLQTTNREFIKSNKKLTPDGEQELIQILHKNNEYFKQLYKKVSEDVKLGEKIMDGVQDAQNMLSKLIEPYEPDQKLLD